MPADRAPIRLGRGDAQLVYPWHTSQTGRTLCDRLAGPVMRPVGFEWGRYRLGVRGLPPRRWRITNPAKPRAKTISTQVCTQVHFGQHVFTCTSQSDRAWL